jgi:type I restriction enzyme, S subunit
MSTLSISKLGPLTSLISSGSTPLGGASRYLDDGPVIFLRSQNVLMNELDLRDVAFINRALHDEMARSKVRSGDVLINITGASIGRVAPYVENGRPANVNQHVCIIRPKPDLLDFRYLSSYLASPKFQDTIDRMQRGGTRQALTFDMIAGFEVPLPPLHEQRRIVAVLDKADAIRRKREEGVRLTEELLRSTFLEMFGDPQTNPKKWPIAAFHNVCESRLGKMLDAKRETGQHSRAYLRNYNVQWGRLDLSSLLTMDFDPRERQEFRLVDGDVLICEGGAGVGQTAVWRNELPECYFQKSLHRVRPRPDKATSEYISFLMKEMIQSGGILGSISSATIPHLTGEKLKSVQVPVPPVALQREFEATTRSVRAVSASRGRASKAADILRRSLVQRAFRGEL